MYTAVIHLPSVGPRILRLAAKTESEAWDEARAACTPGERVAEMKLDGRVTGTITGWDMRGLKHVFIDGKSYRLAHTPTRFYTKPERTAAVGTVQTLILDDQGLGRFETAQFPDGPNRGGPNMTFLDKDNL